jgi:hypothetical protein
LRTKASAIEAGPLTLALMVSPSTSNDRYP